MSDQPQKLKVSPQPGPQAQFFTSPADIVIYGGAAGGGKSWSLVHEPLRHNNTPGFGAIIFRRTRPELMGSGSIWDEAKAVYQRIEGTKVRENPKLEARFKCTDENGNSVGKATVEFAGLEHEDDVYNHQSKQYTLIEFDELTHFTEKQFWYMVSRNRSTCGVRPYIRAACNPDPDSFVRELIDWWIGGDGFPIQERSGVVRWALRLNDKLHWANTRGELILRFGTEVAQFAKSLTFIPAKVTDNKKLLELDPQYLGNLHILPRVDREQLLHGNWNIRVAAGLYVSHDDFNIVSDPPPPTQISEVVRAWDKAASEPTSDYPDPDWTVGVKLARTVDDKFYVLDVVRFRHKAGLVQEKMKRVALADGPSVKVCLWQDPGGAGKNDVHYDKQNLSGFSVNSEVAKEDKLTYFKPFAASVEAGNVYVLNRKWTGAYIRELESFAGKDTKGKKDQVDATSLAFMKVSKSAIAMLRALAKMK